MEKIQARPLLPGVYRAACLRRVRNTSCAASSAMAVSFVMDAASRKTDRYIS